MTPNELVARFAADPEILAAIREKVDAEIRRRVAALTYDDFGDIYTATDFRAALLRALGVNDE